MKIFATTIKAVNPFTGDICEYAGPNVEALSEGMANEYLQLNGLGYCEVQGEIVSEIPCDENYKADFNKQTNYINSQLN